MSIHVCTSISTMYSIRLHTMLRMSYHVARVLISRACVHNPILFQLQCLFRCCTVTIMASCKRKRLTLRKKIEIVDFCETHTELGVRRVAEKFEVGKTQISVMLKDKELLRKEWISNKNENEKWTKRQKTETRTTDDEVMDWFTKLREKNMPISGSMIQEKSRDVAKKHGVSECHGSNGWLEKFRKRHNISYKAVCGEAAAVDKEAVEAWKAKLPGIIAKYESRDIFNADETGLFFRVLPNKTMAFKDEICTGGKISKERLTVLLCCNMEGDFERPLVIGKAKRPRAFKKLDVSKFPVEWYWNTKAWMTTTIMTSWLAEFDKKMQKKKRKVLLFVDNAAPHPHLKLKNVELIFFPPNMIQPLDQGIIQQFKKLYRRKLLQKAIASDEARSAITVLDAVYWTAAAYKEVKPETVKKCFLRSGFCYETPHH